MASDENELTRYLELISTVEEIENVVWALHEAEGNGDSHVAQSLKIAFLQQLSDPGSYGKVVKPHWESWMDGSPFDPSTVDWDVLIAAAQNEKAARFVRGRVGHLIWAHKPGKDTIAIADAAIAALLDLAGDKAVDDLVRISYAGEAASLAKTLRRDVALQLVQKQLLELADDAIDAAGTESSRPAALISAVDLFRSSDGSVVQARDRLQRGLEAHGSGAIRTDLARRLIALADPAERPSIAETEIDRMLEEAKGQEAFRRERLAREALVMARQFGLKDAQGRAAAVIAAITPADFNFKTLNLSVPLPPDEIEKFRTFLAKLTAREPAYAWNLWCSMFPPLKPFSEREAPLMGVMEALATRVTVSNHGHVTDSVTTEEQRSVLKHYEGDRQDHEYLYQFAIGPGLQLLLNRQGGREALESLIEASELFTEIGKARIAKAVAAFDNSEWDTVADTLPTIETAIRHLALSSGVSPYSPSGDANQFKTLGGLISDVTQHLEEARLGRFWAFALTDSAGYNLRNEYLHGMNESPSQFEATLVIQILVQLLLLVAHVQTETQTD